MARATRSPSARAKKRWQNAPSGGCGPVSRCRRRRKPISRSRPMSVRAEVFQQFEQVATEQSKSLAPLADDLPLLDSGLDSLCFAIIVARLEDRLGVDPL